MRVELIDTGPVPNPMAVLTVSIRGLVWPETTRVEILHIQKSRQTDLRRIEAIVSFTDKI